MTAKKIALMLHSVKSEKDFRQGTLRSFFYNLGEVVVSEVERNLEENPGSSLGFCVSVFVAYLQFRFDMDRFNVNLYRKGC